MNNSVYQGDSLEVLKSIPEGIVDLTVTSPPYFNAKMYSQYKTYKDYLDTMRDIFTEVFRVTKKSRMVIVNISPVIIPRESRSKQSYRIPIPFHFVPLMEQIGFEFLEDIIWEKPSGAAIPRNRSFFQHRKPIAYKPNIVTEYILVFKKPAPFLIDKVLKDEPITDRDIQWTNIWKMQPETHSIHPAPFPEVLAKNCITYYSYQGDLVLDPFAGSGTVGVCCEAMNRKYIMIEQDKEYCEIIKQRLIQYEATK